MSDCKHGNLMRHEYHGQVWWQCEEGCDFIFRQQAYPIGAFQLTSVNYDPVMARTHVMVPNDLKCHKCGAEEPWKDPLRKEVAETLDKLERGQRSS